MMYHILLACSLIVGLVSGQRYQKSIEAQPRVGYSTSIVHTYPGYNDLKAESTINVEFQPQQLLSSRRGNKYTQVTSNTPNTNLFTGTSFINDQKPPNLFNVGYNLSFNENSYSPKKKEQRYNHLTGTTFENAEVITGKIKKNEKVRAPNINPDLSPQDFVSSAFLKQKQITGGGSIRHTSTPTKTSSAKHISPVLEQTSKYPSQSSKFTYKTQPNIFKDVVKSTRSEAIQLNPDFRTSYETTNKWKSNRPVIETSKKVEPVEYDEIIYEKSRGLKHTKVEPQFPSNFNHDVALKNSETFDFSNAHGKITFGDGKEIFDNSPAASEQYRSYEVPEHSSGANNVDANNAALQQASDINDLNIEAHIPKNLRGVKPLPLDTSLLKDPVLTTTFKESSKYSRVIPIHFDIKPIQIAMQKELSKVQSFAPNQNLYGGNQQVTNHGYTPQQSYNPTNDGEGLTYEDHDASPGQTSFRMYGKPEPIDKDLFRVGMSYGKERANYEEDIYKIVSMRPPPVAQNFRY